jgi:hypothetical protein
MAALARLIALRGGVRTAAQRISERLEAIFDMAEMYPYQKVHELESKIADLTARLAAIEDYDQQILALTDPDDLQREVEETDVENIPFRNQIYLQRYQVNTLRRNHGIGDENQVIRQNPSTRSASRPKLALPRFNGDILQWQPFWQAFCAEINDDETLADINKFNYLVGQLDQNVLSTVARLTPSNENYEVLVDLLTGRYGRKPKVIAAYMHIRKSVARRHDKDEFSLEEFKNALKEELRVMEAEQFSTLPAY